MRRGVALVCAWLATTASFAQQPQTNTLPVPEAAANVCAPCHTVEGIGKDVEIPNLAGQHVIYLINQIKAFRSGTRRHAEMKFIARELTDAEIRELAEYYDSLPGQ